jgi:hypothetical protein
MRELIAKWRSLADLPWIGDEPPDDGEIAVNDALHQCADELEALLARTEAGADGVEPFGWWIECHGTDGDFGQFVTDRAFVELLRSHGVVERETALFSRPQDASGDAVSSAASLLQQMLDGYDNPPSLLLTQAARIWLKEHATANPRWHVAIRL